MEKSEKMENLEKQERAAMKIRENPFTPTFGEIPLYMAGREAILRSMARALDREGRAPELTTLIQGARGTGKTALLARIAEEAEGHGWICANVTAAPGMLDDILVQAVRASEHLVGSSEGPKLTGVGLGQILNLEWEPAEPIAPSTFRSHMTDLVKQLQPQGIGLLITVDEVQHDLDEMIQLAATYQQFVRERRRVGLLMAGLPFHIEELKKNEVVSFLRRAEHQFLGRVNDQDVQMAFQKTISQGGRSINEQALDHAVQAINGFPFMLQLVGYRSWEESPEATELSYADVVTGANLARIEMRERIFESTYRDLSDGDLNFLAAMLPDENNSAVKDIAARMGKPSSYVNTYRRRMLRQGIIGERRRGEVGFDLPAFKEFLAEKLAE